MFDELNETSNNLHTGEEQQTVSQPTAQPNAEWESAKQESMRVLRERADNAERRAIELERMVQMNMSQQQSSRQQQQQDQDEDDFDIKDEDFIEGKQLKKYVRSLQKESKNTRKELEEYKQQVALTQAEMKLKSQFNDFDSIVTEENWKKLETQKPALFRTILSNNNVYDRGYAAYELIKNSGILTNEYQEIDRKVEENRSKPRSAATASPQAGETPLGRVGDYDRRIMTNERRTQLLKQVEEAKRLR